MQDFNQLLLELTEPDAQGKGPSLLQLRAARAIDALIRVSQQLSATIESKNREEAVNAASLAGMFREPFENPAPVPSGDDLPRSEG